MNREQYQRNYATEYDRRGPSVIVPDDVERVSVHEPCFMCGSARGLCRHRRAA